MVEYFYSVTDEELALNSRVHKHKIYRIEEMIPYKKEMDEFGFYTPTPEEQAMIDQYLAMTDAEYRARNHANIDSSVKRFNAELIEKYGAENLDPEDFLVILEEAYHVGLFENYFRECIDKVEKKFLNEQIHADQECMCLPIFAMNEALREMLAQPDYSECIASFLATDNGHTSHIRKESNTNTTDHINGDISLEHVHSSISSINDSGSLTPTTREELHTSDKSEMPGGDPFRMWSEDKNEEAPLVCPSHFKYTNIPESNSNKHASISVIPPLTDDTVTSDLSSCCPPSSANSLYMGSILSGCTAESRSYLQETHLKN